MAKPTKSSRIGLSGGSVLGEDCRMATKDLIKRMSKSKDVRPDPMKRPEVKTVTLDEAESAMDRIKEEIESMAKEKELPDREYLDRRFDKLHKEVRSLENKLEDIINNMELIMLSKDAVEELIEFFQKAKEKEPGLLKKLFRSTE